jgi:hypothetical protein
MLALDQLTAAYFSPFLHQPFSCAGLTLHLVEIPILGPQRPGTERQPFALRFEGEPTLRLPQSIYHLSHPQAGEMEIFIVQTAADTQRSSFEAIFN